MLGILRRWLSARPFLEQSSSKRAEIPYGVGDSPHGFEVKHYRFVARKLPRPTLLQMKAFAEYVAKSHSWYKHLPWWTFTDFQFYLDPAAGMDLRIDGDGNVIAATERLEHGFHYSSIKTANYRERFGHLAYSDRRKYKVFLLEKNVKIDQTIRANLLADARAAVSTYFDLDESERRDLPLPVGTVGTASLSALMHPLSQTLDMVIYAFPSVLEGDEATPDANGPPRGFRRIDRRLTLLHGKELLQAGRLPSWPEASGGNEQLFRIIDRALQLIADPLNAEPMTFIGKQPVFGQDRVLFELLAPERNRQLAEIVAACERVCVLVHEES
jgi:hypothetical protein